MVPQFTWVDNKLTRTSYIRTGALQSGSDTSSLTLLDIVTIFQTAHSLTATNRRAL